MLRHSKTLTVLLLIPFAIMVFPCCSSTSDDKMEPEMEMEMENEEANCINGSIGCLSENDPMNHICLDCTDPLPFLQECDVIFNGTFRLGEESLSKLPNFCIEEGEFIILKNNDGDQKAFEMKNKIFKTDRSILYNYTGGPGTGCKNFCIISDVAEFILESDDIKLQFRLNSVVDWRSLQEISVGDFLAIESIEEDVNLPLFHYVTASRTLKDMDDDYTRITYYEEITINGKTFSNIITEENSSSIDIFYSDELGFIGYKDISEIDWVIE